ncbi:hypothetical protein CEXT_165671 [Caerostris extrusa]|uniref:DUF5641 domain-containing protein n=1 Tax=Caerostris extrusa TaxID=172846 RepID=A0AAV4SPU3_CAEEX|nr:hypothetical protein CEXT_165671 [Caerostris extrusa]
MDKKLYDKQMLEQFDESIKFSDWRDEVKLSRKFDNIDLANNYDVAKRRFEYLVTRFRKNPSLFKDQKAVMQANMDKIKLELQESVPPWWGGVYERLVKCVKDPSWKNSRTWKIRDVVLIHGTQKFKLLWDLGIIKEVIDGPDHLIRACVMKIAKGLFRKPCTATVSF